MRYILLPAFLLFALSIAFLPKLMHSVVAPKPSPEWELVSETEVPREGAATLVVGEYIYFFTGFVDKHFNVSQRVDRFHPKTRSWKRMKDMPVPVTHVGVARVGNRVWFNGGLADDFPGKPTELVQIYNLDSDSWELGPPLPEPATSAGLAYAGGLLHSFGGVTADNQTNTDAHYVINPHDKNAKWRKLSVPVPNPRTHFSTIVVDDQIYMIGGEYGHRIVSEDVRLMHRFNQDTRQWTRLADMPAVHSHHDNSTFAYDGKIYALGGRSYRELAIDTVAVYDIEADRWTHGTPLPKPLIVSSAKKVGDVVIAGFGGVNSYKYPYNGVWSLPFAALEAK